MVSIYVAATRMEVGGKTIKYEGNEAFQLYEEKFKCTSKPCDHISCLASQRRTNGLK